MKTFHSRTLALALILGQLSLAASPARALAEPPKAKTKAENTKTKADTQANEEVLRLARENQAQNAAAQAQLILIQQQILEAAKQRHLDSEALREVIARQNELAEQHAKDSKTYISPGSYQMYMAGATGLGLLGMLASWFRKVQTIVKVAGTGAEATGAAVVKAGEAAGATAAETGTAVVESRAASIAAKAINMAILFDIKLLEHLNGQAPEASIYQGNTKPNLEDQAPSHVPEPKSPGAEATHA